MVPIPKQRGGGDRHLHDEVGPHANPDSPHTAVGAGEGNEGFIKRPFRVVPSDSIVCLGFNIYRAIHVVH